MERENNPEQAAPAADEGGEGGGGGGGGGRFSRGPRQMIRITISDAKQIHYKNYEFLRQFVTDRGKLRPRRQTGITAHQQRLVAQAVKRARHIALLPFDREAD
jgi:small subunit ribosomal protein S18